MDHERTTQAPAAQSQTVDDTVSQAEHIYVFAPSSRDNNGVTGRDTRTQASSTERPLLNRASEGYPSLSQSHESPYADFEHVPATRPARSRDGHVRVSSRRQGSVAPRDSSALDWIVPVGEKSTGVSAMFFFFLFGCGAYTRHVYTRRAVP